MNEKVEKFDLLTETQKTCVVLEVCASTIELLFFCTKEFYLKNFYDEIMKSCSFYDYDLVFEFFKNALNYPYGIRFFRLFLNIFNIFTNFPNNHLLREDDLIPLERKDRNIKIRMEQGK